MNVSDVNIKGKCSPSGQASHILPLFASFSSEMVEYPEQKFCFINPFLWCGVTQPGLGETMVSVPNPGSTEAVDSSCEGSHLAAKASFSTPAAECACEGTRWRFPVL